MRGSQPPSKTGASLMTDKAISPLRQRMIEDMTIRKFAPKTQHDYVQRVKHFTAFLGRSPDTASFEDVRRYQLHLAAGGAGVPTLNQSVSTLRFFFRITLGRVDILNHTQFVHEPRKLPVVLSPEEVARFLESAPGLKYKAALSVAYGAGLRVSEVVALKVSDIDSKRMVIRIEQGTHRDLVQLLPQPALPEVPGRGGKGLAGGARSRSAAGAVLPCRVHAAGADRRHRLSQQGGRLRSAVQGLGRDPDHDRR